MTRPNLFRYGHKELSQDAMICWLLDWANRCYADTCPALHEAGRRFARALFAKHGRPGPERIETVQLGMQVASIDVLAWINGEYALLIEDKTDTGAHGNQLERYHRQVLGGLAIWDDGAQASVTVKPSPDKFFPIFLKTGSMSLADKKYIERERHEFHPPYRVFERKDFLDALEGCDRNASEILAAFHDHLMEKERLTQAYRCAPLSEWPWDAWPGFFRCLEEKMPVEGWNYVPNRAGGFMGLWWHWQPPQPGGEELHLQIEQEKLCFKIKVGDASKRGERRRYWHERIVEAGRASALPIVKPARFGSGRTMTVAILEGDFRRAGADGRLDLDATLAILRQAEQVLSAAAEAAAADSAWSPGGATQGNNASESDA